MVDHSGRKASKEQLGEIRKASTFRVPKIGMKFLTKFESKSHSTVFKKTSYRVHSELSRPKHNPLVEQHLFSICIFVFFSPFIVIRYIYFAERFRLRTKS